MELKARFEGRLTLNGFLEKPKVIVVHCAELGYVSVPNDQTPAGLSKAEALLEKVLLAKEPR